MHFDPWTLALQTINVTVLIWLLARFLFRPVAGIIAERRATAAAVLADAEAIRAKAAAEAALLAEQRQGLVSDGERIAAAARGAAEAERATILRQADEAAARLRRDAEQAIARTRQEMREALQHEAADLSVSIAARLLERLPAQTLNRAFLDGIAAALAESPARASLASAPIEIRSASPLDVALQTECRAMLRRQLGGEPQIEFRSDPALIAGIELASQDVVIRNSWRSDLERLASVLHTEEGDIATHVA